jgi:hypothetical protein
MPASSEKESKHQAAASLLPDRALHSTAEDLLNRGSFAEALASQILHAPAGQTLRLGVYGGWGEGKTSVLELMRLHLTTAQQVCVWITPWTVPTREEVMGQIVDQLCEQLRIDDKALMPLKRAKRFALFAKATTTAAHEGSWWSKTGAQLLESAVQRRFAEGVARESERFFEVVQEHLNGRRVVVFIDDIDRVKPDLVPDLLLTLREALDQPNFFYVMALAPEIVERGLAMVHHGWGTAGDFLEKIVEYPRYLPVATNDEIEFFIHQSISALNDAVDAAAVQQLIPLLPRNPRKLKLYLRFMASLYGVLRRFDPAEIDLHMLYTVQLLRSEFPDEARAIAKDEQALKDLEHGHILELMKSKRAAPANETPPARPCEKYLDDTASPERKERFDQLYNAVRSRDAFLKGSYRLPALFVLPDEPPLFTWKELNDFVPRFAAEAAKDGRGLIEAQIAHEGVVDPARARALFDLTLQIREAALGQASEALLDADRAATLSEAATLTDILDVFVHDLGVFKAPPLLPAAQWKALLAHVQRWSHFKQPDDYAALRSRERALVASSVETMADEVRTAVLDHFGPLHAFDLRGSESDEFRSFLADLRRALEQWAIGAILRHLETVDGLEAYWGDRGSLGMKSVLFKNDSPLFRNAESRAAFDTLAGRAAAVPSIQQNFVQLTRMLFYGAIEGGSFSRDEARHMIQDRALMKVVWSAALATPLNPRTAGGLREKRLRLINDGVIDQAYADAVLAVPEWWQVLEGTFFIS